MFMDRMKMKTRSHEHFACLNPVYILLPKVLAFYVLSPHLVFCLLNGVLQTILRMLKGKFYIHLNLN